MKTMLLALLLLSVTFAWDNPAWPEVLEARYDYTACNVQWAKDFVELREGCADEEGVPIFDSSDYIEDIDENLADLKKAAEDDDRIEFGLTLLALGGDGLELTFAIVADALDDKSPDFFTCVQDGTPLLKEDLEECRAGALATAETAATHFMEYDLEHADELIDELGEDGVDTSGMEAVVEDGEELLDDIPAAFEEDDPVEARKIGLRHSRLVNLFQLERMSAICEYVLPIMEEEGFEEELIEEVEDLNGEIEDLITECEYSAEIEDNRDYANENLDCWADTWDIYEDFVSLKGEIVFGG